MPAVVDELTIAIPTQVLEAQDVVSSSEPGYPFPSLRPTQAIVNRDFRCLSLENSYLKIVIAPELGGRILSVFDKREQRDLIAVPQQLAVNEGGIRDCTLPHGIQFTLTGEERLNALGKVACQVEEGDEPAIWIGEFSQCLGLSWHLRIALPGDRAVIQFEARVFNRTTEPQPYNGGFLGVPEGWNFGQSLNSEFLRHESVRHLEGREVDHWTCELAPFPSSPTIASSRAAVWIDGQQLSIRVSERLSNSKVFLHTEGGQTLEASFDLYPETPIEVPLAEKVVGLILQDAERKRLLELPRLEPSPQQMEITGTRHLLHLNKAISEIKEGLYADADTSIEQSLLYNGDDPLAWWAKAALQRLQGNSEESSEIQNAHYLAPMEPLLRAEAFLSQQAGGISGSPLLKNMPPEDFIEVACVLLEHGMIVDASRWMDEALRHHDLAMLHYLYADALLASTRMEAEAAEHVSRGGKAQLPPYPWRTYEFEALSRLSARFPSDQRLTWLNDL